MLSAPFIMTSPTTDWDHLRPLVRNRRPTGFISEIKNLVPSCGLCNQSKGAADWKAWMTGKARGSPTTRGVKDVADRVCRLNRLLGKCQAGVIRGDGPAPDVWCDYWDQLTTVMDAMCAASSGCLPKPFYRCFSPVGRSAGRLLLGGGRSQSMNSTWLIGLRRAPRKTTTRRPSVT